MDFGAEIINISKIKDSFFIGDKIAGTNIDVLIQFKISHILNAAGNQIMNYFESIGIQYYTLYWSENPKQILFDSNDEIVDKILMFIRDSFIKGEGLLIHSVKGKNRCCVVVIIYLMKKYYWSVNKCIDFLKSKKEDIEIEPYFIEQLLSYEMRLSKITNIKTSDWKEITFKDNDENLLRNTYVNGLPIKQLDSIGINEINNNNINKEDTENLNKKNKIHIKWAENDNLVNLNLERELLFQDEIKNITCHMSIKPMKSSIKKKIKIKNNSSLSQNLSITSKININNSNNNNTYGNKNKKKLKIRPDVNLDKISSEFNNISPNIIKQLIENDSFYFVSNPKNNTLTNLNIDKNKKQTNKSERPLSYDNNKKNINNKKDINKENKNINNNYQINIRSYSQNKNGNTGIKKIKNNCNINNNYFINDQNKIKKLLENSQGNKLLNSLNNQNKMNILINNFTYLNNNYANGNSQFKKINNNSQIKNFINDNNSNNLSLTLKKGYLENNKFKSKFIYTY